jgi:acyl dehydratase
VRAGDKLPPLRIPLTSTLIIATAIASRDYQDVHHDVEAARRAGSKDIFMNILSTNGFVGRYVTDWAGPEAVVRRIAIRLGAPNYPGDTMRLEGRVARTDAREGSGLVEIELRARNSYGDHATGTVLLELPRGG